MLHEFNADEPKSAPAYSTTRASLRRTTALVTRIMACNSAAVGAQTSGNVPGEVDSDTSAVNIADRSCSIISIRC
jgi:hypothetical protein